MMGVQEIKVSLVSQAGMTQPRLRLELMEPSSLRESANTSSQNDGGCDLLVDIDALNAGQQVLTNYQRAVSWCKYTGQKTLKWNTMKVRITQWDGSAAVFNALHIQLITHSTLTDPTLPITNARVAAAGDQLRFTHNLMGL